MFGLGFGEILIILVLALILLGPQKLPDAAKQLGKTMREFRKATEDLKSQFDAEMYSEERPKPKLVEPPPQTASEDPSRFVPPGGVPAAATGPAPLASAANVPGLDAATAEPALPPPERPVEVAQAEPAPRS